MKMKPRVVIDTNVAVSAILMLTSVPRQVFDKVLMLGRLLVSKTTLAELRDVLARPKFDKYISPAKRLEFFTALVSEAELITIAQTITECRDPKDNKFLELAVNGNADCIISGDNDLLVMNPFRGIVIISPADFLADSSLWS